MPHMGSALLRLLGLALALRLGPAGLRDLPRAPERERVLRHVLGDRAARADVGALAHGDRGHERGVAADEGPALDLRLVLVDAVVVAGDGAGADVDARPDRGVAEVAQVLGLRARAELRLLELDEVADPRLLAHAAVGPPLGQR